MFYSWVLANTITFESRTFQDRRHRHWHIFKGQDETTLGKKECPGESKREAVYNHVCVSFQSTVHFEQKTKFHRLGQCGSGLPTVSAWIVLSLEIGRYICYVIYHKRGAELGGGAGIGEFEGNEERRRREVGRGKDVYASICLYVLPFLISILIHQY